MSDQYVIMGWVVFAFWASSQAWHPYSYSPGVPGLPRGSELEYNASHDNMLGWQSWWWHLVHALQCSKKETFRSKFGDNSYQFILFGPVKGNTVQDLKFRNTLVAKGFGFWSFWEILVLFRGGQFLFVSTVDVHAMPNNCTAIYHDKLLYFPHHVAWPCPQTVVTSTQCAKFVPCM